VPRRLRLDAELVRRGLARSREHAAELIAAGRVSVSGAVAGKPATGVTTDVAIVVRDDPDRPDYASRGGHKLAGALEAFEPAGLAVVGRRCLDAGASTGGFTDVLLRHGARQVVAVDVGYGQLAWPLRSDDRVVVHDRTNVRELTAEMIGGPVDLVVGDLSFISLELVLDPLIGVTAPDGDLALMVKPQFEVGKGKVGAGGVVRSPADRAGAREVVAVDVGYGQLAWSLRSDDRVQVHDRTNVRELTTELIGGAVDLVVGDLSFISLALVLEPLVGVTREDGDLALMVKPQFEVGKDRVGKGGVVRDPGLHAETVAQSTARELTSLFADRDIVTFEMVERSVIGGSSALLRDQTIDLLGQVLAAHPRPS